MKRLRDKAKRDADTLADNDMEEDDVIGGSSSGSEGSQSDEEDSSDDDVGDVVDAAETYEQMQKSTAYRLSLFIPFLVALIAVLYGAKANKAELWGP